MTLTGLQLGSAPTASIPNSINVATSEDAASSTGAASGAIGGQIHGVKFSMDAADRVAGRKCSATFSFVTATPLPAGGSISLVYPSGLFAFFIPLDSSTRVDVSDVPQASLGVSVILDNPSLGASTTATISFTPTYVDNFNRLVITLTGFKCVPGQSNLVSSFGGIDENQLLFRR